MDDGDRRARLRERLEREAEQDAQRPRVPGRTTLVEQTFGPRMPTAGAAPGKATLVPQHAEPIDAQSLLTQARQALAGAGDRDAAYNALVAALASHATALPPEQSGAMMDACIELLQSRKAPAAVAARGVAGASSQLPFHDEIQASFGRHDISGVRAQVGGEAAAAAGALGARAYATGDRVAFGGAPDLHTAAHEAAHVVQQRSGVQLKAIDGGASDAHEQHADAVADAVVRGESAEALLSSVSASAGSTHASGVVQRDTKSGTPSTVAAHDDELTKPPNSKWHVLAKNRLPYEIISAQPPVRIRTVSDWIRAGAGFQAHGNHAQSPACAAEIVRALGWVPAERVDFAAKNIVFDISKRVVVTEVSASAFYFLGMPTSAPIVSRSGPDTIYVTTRANDPNVPPGTPIEPDDSQRVQVIRALADFTGLAPAAGALGELRNSPRFQTMIVGNGALRWEIDKETGNNIFGYDETSDDAGPYTRWLYRKSDKKPPKANGADKLKLHNFYGEPIPGELKPDRKVVEAGHPIWLEVKVDWPKNYPSPNDYEVVPMVTPGHGSGDVALLKCEWHVELVGGGGGAGATATPNTADASPPTASRTAQPAASASSSPSNSGASATSPASPAASGSITAKSGSAIPPTNVGELQHAFVLPPGQATGKFLVTVRASFDEYFEPAEFSTPVDVSSTAAAMKQLGDEAFADLGAHETSRTAESFDSSGSGDDNHGFRTGGELPASFKPSTVDGPDPRAPAREADRKRLEAARMYLQANGATADVLAAVDRELEASRATETALASDRTNGWQPFQIRGTYLSREDGVPSGSLDLYGSVHAGTRPGLKAHNVQQTPDQGEVVVQIRDLSRRFDNKDMTFSGEGDTFESALKDAFTKNAKSYPKGVMAIEAEAIDTHVDGSQATIGKGNGKTIGFEIGTDSRWKRATAAVFDPVVNIATNLGAMALMAFVPGSAVVVAPFLIAYNSAPVIDRLRTESERGTLTPGGMATSVGEIALNLLPLVGRAKPFTKAWFLVEGANWGGQAVLMTASAIDAARGLQAVDVEALAAMYEDLQALEQKPGADPAQIDQKRQAIMLRAKDVSDRIQQTLSQQIATNAMFAVAGTVIHNAGTDFQRGAVVDGFLNARGVEPNEHQPGIETSDHGRSADAKDSSGGAAPDDAAAKSGAGAKHNDNTAPQHPEQNPTSNVEQHPTAAHDHAGAHDREPPRAGTEDHSGGTKKTSRRDASTSPSHDTEGSTRSESAEPRDAAKVQTEHPALQQLASLPPEVMFGAQQQARAQHAVQSLAAHDYAEFTAIVSSTPDPIAKGFLYKAVAAGNSIADVKWLGAEIAGKDRGWLIDNLTLGDPRGVGGGVKQQWSTSCNAAMTITLRGNYDPVFALRLRVRNMEVGAVDIHDPHAMNMNQADLEKQMLESQYQGNHPGSPKPHQGLAAPRASQGTGRFADDLLNSQAASTGLAFGSVENPSGTQVVAVLERSLASGMQVPLVVGDMAAPQAHYVLVQSRRESGGEIEYSIHDPWTGQSSWIKASDIANDTIPGPYHKVGTVEVPSQAVEARAQPSRSTPQADTTQFATKQQPHGAPETTRPDAAKALDLDAFVGDSPAFADRMAKGVAPERAAAVRDVEVRALVSDAQVESGLRVMDPVFGKKASNAFKDAATSGDEQLISSIASARDDAMQSMLTTLRDPRLDIAARRKSLVSELTKYENALKAHPKLDRSSIDFAEARAQALALSEKSFADMLTVDEKGDLSHAGKPAGTLHELIATVKSANAAYRERKVAREFVIAITSPADPKVSREVKLLTRVPKESAAAAPSKIIGPLDNVDGTVVDIGVGLGSFARDAAKETGPLVQTEYGPKYADAAMTRRDLSWEHTGPRTDVDSVLVLGDSLQTLSMMFEQRSVKRLFINNINAHYTEGSAEYIELATGLRRVMAVGGQVEVQWTDDPETTGGKTSSRGHITGPELSQAIQATAAAVPRQVSAEEAAQPVTDFNYSVEAPRTKSGIPSKTKPTDPVPKFRTVFTFGE